MLFDTGSCELWIPSQKCTTNRCLTHNRYNRTESFEEVKGGVVSIQVFLLFFFLSSKCVILEKKNLKKKNNK